MREKIIEEKLTKAVRQKGGVCWKFTSPGTAGVPDRIVLIRHVMYCCSASRPATESATTEESTEVKTEKLSLKATPLPTGLVKSKTTESTTDTVYNNWFKMPYNPDTTVKSSAKTS